jgi:hypothetical protein
MASELFLSLGIGCPIRIGDKVYTLSQMNWRMMADFEEWVRYRFWSEIDLSDADDSDIQERYELTEKACLPVCEHGGEEFESAWQSYDGFIYQVWLRFNRNHPEVTLEQVQSWVKGRHGDAIVSRIAWMERTEKGTRSEGEKASTPFRSVCAILTGEPWRLSLDQISNLTPWQTNEIYFHQRYQEGDKAGQIVLPENIRTLEERQQEANEFYHEMKERGYTDEQIDAAWIKRLGG